MSLYKNFQFSIEATSGGARAGILKTPHGDVRTPAFIFCATKAATRVATPQVLREEGTEIILANTYHLMLQPTADVVEQQGGLQQFTGWRGPMLTDSGGFQIFSMGHGHVADEIKGRRSGKHEKSLLKITEDGATFRSYVDGRKITLTPEDAMDIQAKLGADLVVVLDECTPFNVDKAYTQKSLYMTNRWAKRCLTHFEKNDTSKQALYGIVQGGIYEDLRKESVEFLNGENFFAHAIGGSLGQNREQMYDVVRFTAQYLRKDRPVHLLGIGGIRDIWEHAGQGIDTFDCVHPTRLARHGGALAVNNKERINLPNARYRHDSRPIDETCTCYTCRTFSRSYLHHIVRTGEPLAQSLLSIHNIHFMNKLMRTVRQSILENTFEQVKKEWLGRLEEPVGEI
jgi:queuine tRNA-ribosyltransferase